MLESEHEQRMFRRRELKNRWMAHYALKYGVQPVEVSALVVVRAKCRFCEFFGRERASTAASPKRRKKRQTLKMFGPNFRSDNLESHLWREHATKWHEYEQLADEEKQNFFPVAQQENRNSNFDAGENRNTVETGRRGSSTSDSSRSAATSLLSPVSEESSVRSSNSPAEIRVEASSAVLEVLDQLLGIKAAGSTLQPFVFESDADDQARAREEVDSRSNWLDDGDSLLVSEPLFFFFVDTFRAGVSMDAMLAVLQATRQLQPMLDPANVLNDGDPVTRMHVVRAIQQIMALNLSAIATLTANLWGFSLALHFSIMENDFTENSARRGGLLDVRLQLPVAGDLQEVHLVTLPLSLSHVNATGASAIGAAIVRILCAVDLRAMEKIIGVTVSGDPFEMGALGIGVARWLRSQAQLAVTVSGTSNGSIATFYIRPSATFLLSLAIEDVMTAFQREFAFISSLAGIDKLFKTNKALRELLVSDTNPLTLGTASVWEHGGTRVRSTASSPSLRTHWTRVSAQCEWLVMHRETLTQWQSLHCNEADAKSLAPALASNLFWVLVFLFRDLLKDLQVTLQHCDYESVSYSDVQQHVREFLSQLRLKFNIKPTNESSQVSLGADPTTDATTSFIYQDFVNAIIPLDLFMYEAFQLKTVEGIGDTERESIFKHFSILLVELQSNLQSAVASSATPSESTQSETSAASVSAIHSSVTFKALKQDCGIVPPSTPNELMTLSNLAFMELLNGNQARLRARWSGKMLTRITDERNRLVTAFAQCSDLYEIIGAKHQQQRTGNDAWSGVRVEYPSLSCFATVFGAHLAVSKPTAMLIPEELLGSASTTMLEAQLQALQHRKLVALAKQLEDTA